MFIAVFLLANIYSISQDLVKGNITGTLIIGEKPVEFNYLSMPDGTMELPYFTHLPTKDEIAANFGKDFLSLQTVKKIVILRFSNEELEFLHDTCSGCSLFKANITFNHHTPVTEKSIYLAVKYLIWKNTGSIEFPEPRVAEMRYVDAIQINEGINKVEHDEKLSH